MSNLSRRFQKSQDHETKQYVVGYSRKGSSLKKEDVITMTKPPSVEKRSRGRPHSGKETVTLRISSNVLAHFRATGKGWQARLNETLLSDLNLTDP